MSRRAFAKSLAAAAAVIGFDPVQRSWMTGAQAASAAPSLVELPEQLKGQVTFDPAVLKLYARDFGNIVSEKPMAVFRPLNVASIPIMIRYARANHLRVATRGQGHLPFGQAQVSAGIVVDMSLLNQVLSIDTNSQQIVVEAGATWELVFNQALEAGLTPPVLTEFLGLSVGGTLSIGGIGNATWKYGAQVDNVSELQVATGRGDLVTCSETVEPALFNAALAGQGQCGIITRATLKLVPAPQKARVFRLFYANPTFDAISADLSLVRQDGRFDGANTFVFPGFPQAPGVPPPFIQAVKYFDEGNEPSDAELLAGLNYSPFIPPQVDPDVSYADYIRNRFPGISDGIRPALSAMIPESKANQYLQTIFSLLSPKHPEEQMFLQTFSWNTGLFNRPLLRKVETEAVGVGVAILRIAPFGTSGTRVEEMLSENRIAFEECRDIAGALYPFSAVEMTHADWVQHYGQTVFQFLQNAKSVYDPDNVFASGPDIFVDPVGVG